MGYRIYMRAILQVLLSSFLFVIFCNAPQADLSLRELAYQDYLFRLHDKTVMDEGKPFLLEQTLVVLKNNQEVFRKTGHRWYISDKHPKMGTDITGTGQPNAVITEYSGGAHCCDTNYIFELGQSFKVIEIHSHDFPIIFKELDGRPGLEIEILDTNFLYWKTGFVRAPAPKVILRYDQGAYRVATDLMKRPPMRRRELLRRAEEVRKSTEWGRDERYPLDESLWKVMLDLIYTGNANQAREFADLAWPPSFPGKKEFVAELFECQLRHSTYWPGIAALNGLAPNKPKKDCPILG